MIFLVKVRPTRQDWNYDLTLRRMKTLPCHHRRFARSYQTGAIPATCFRNLRSSPPSEQQGHYLFHHKNATMENLRVLVPLWQNKGEFPGRPFRPHAACMCPCGTSQNIVWCGTEKFYKKFCLVS